MKVLATRTLTMAMFIAAVPTVTQAQEVPSDHLASSPALEEQVERSVSRPFLRTAAAIAGSAAGYSFAQSRLDAAPDDILIPIAAGAAASALGSLLFTNAHPVKVLAGSAAATLPAAALASYLAGVMEDEAQRQIPLVGFTIPQGLITSAFSQHE